MLPQLSFWNIDAALEPMGGGHRNKVVRTSGLKQDLVFKSTRRSEAQLRWLEPVFEAAEASGCVVPKLIPAQDGALVAGGWTCEPFLEGRPFQPEEIPQIADQIDAFHRATLDFLQRPGLLSSHDLLDATTGGDVDLTALPADLIVMCRKAWAGVQGDIAVIHGDLTAGNLIHTDNGPALLDWDEARVDLRFYDTIRTRQKTATAEEKNAVLAWELACSWQIEPDHARIVARVLESRM